MTGSERYPEHMNKRMKNNKANVDSAYIVAWRLSDILHHVIYNNIQDNRLLYHSFKTMIMKQCNLH